ncbi:hypothetical protein ACWNT8_08100 [Pigmentibacter ruber]|uniref:hypothetical protein n=1 Tax=Pigmentibacter ruber TaxID=2683196 RepID=UPI00131DC54B|nr:hypothetical protein [Pigmentibacter ruber]BFD32767.1 hypothetical protein GTC16762_23850 [Pigmentibacter ruber]
MLESIVFIHSWTRWLIALLLLLVLYRSYIGWFKKSEYTKKDHIFGGVLLGLTHLQLVMGLILYFALSPISQAALNNISITMKSTVLRFWGIEHIFTMLLFVIFIQIGRIKTKKSKLSVQKYKSSAIYCTIAVILLLLGTPWTFRKEIGRPNFMGFPSGLNK